MSGYKSSKSALKGRTRGGVLGSSLLGSARHASIAVDRIRIAEVRDWRTPISPGTILDLRQITDSLIEDAGFLALDRPFLRGNYAGRHDVGDFVAGFASESERKASIGARFSASASVQKADALPHSTANR